MTTFKKASATFDSTETYYILNNDVYEVVDSPNADNIADYYVIDYMPATSYDSNAEYYYKKNYKLLEAGADLTEVFELAQISLINNVLSATADNIAKLENILESIDLSFAITIKIKNTSTNIIDYYNMRYNLSIV